VGYRLERVPGGGPSRLTIEATLNEPIRLEVGITCPGLIDLGSWRSRPETPPPDFDRSRHRLSRTIELPIGPSTREWSWG